MHARMAVAILVTILLLLARLTTPAEAEVLDDPEPPLTWDAALACPLIVVAKYQSHHDNELVLEVVQVLTGKVQPKQLITVAVEHRYSIETRPAGWAWRDAKSDGIPRLCYGRQLVNPGGLVPMPIRSDAREGAIYFFRSDDKPALKVWGQVQAPWFQKGWQQALDRQPMDLLFRLTQDLNRELAREACEELGQTRDAACLDQLFAWIVNPAPEGVVTLIDPAVWLSRLGDHQGDVYDRALTPLSSAAPGKKDDRYYFLSLIAVIADERRAWDDLSGLMAEHHPIELRQGVLSGLSRIPKREAAQLALDAMKLPELAESAASAVATQLDGSHNDGFGAYRGLQDDLWLLDGVRAALADQSVPEAAKKTIRDQFGNRLATPPLFSLEAYRQKLFDPRDRMYRGFAESETTSIHDRACDSCDPRVVPLLAEVIDKMPQAKDLYRFREILQHYWLIRPRAMRKEYEKRGLPERVAEKPFLESETTECFELAKQVRAGQREKMELLFAATDRLFARQQGFAALPSLLECDSPVAQDRFLAYVNQAKGGPRNPWSHRGSLGTLTSLLTCLHPKQKELYCDLVLELLASESLDQRQAAVVSLEYVWHCDFSFDPVALEFQRTKKLAQIKPLLERLAAASEPQARVILLARADVTLFGQPNESWLPTLVAAVGKPGNAAPQALRLVETIVGEQHCWQFSSFPPEKRQRALRAYLQDMGKLEM